MATIELELRKDCEAMMRMVGWAVAATLAVGLVAQGAGWIGIDLRFVLPLAAALLASSTTVWWLAPVVGRPVGVYLGAHLTNAVLVTLVIHFVGGVGFLPGPLLYAPIVLNGGIVGPGAAHLLAFASTAAYAALVLAETSGVWPPFEAPGIPLAHVPPQIWPGVLLVIAVTLHVSAAYTARLATILRARYRRAVDYERAMDDRERALRAIEAVQGENRTLRYQAIRDQTFVRIVTHDLKNPINAIYLTADLLLTGGAESAPVRMTDGLERIRQLAAGAEDKILDLMTLSRVLSTTEKSGWVDCSRLARKALDELRPAIVDKGLDVELESLPVVWGRSEKLACVLSQLLSNAVKYSRAGAGTIRIRSRPSPHGVTIVVEDDGIGVPGPYHQRIFDLFARVPDAEQRVDGIVPRGTGVGLALVKEIVEQHHGRVVVRSAPGKGSRFEVHLPEAADATGS